MSRPQGTRRRTRSAASGDRDRILLCPPPGSTGYYHSTGGSERDPANSPKMLPADRRDRLKLLGVAVAAVAVFAVGAIFGWGVTPSGKVDRYCPTGVLNLRA